MDWPLFIGTALGGGGITGLLIKLAQLRQEHAKGQLQREDTAISRWQSIADANEKKLNWYEYHYPRLYSAYMIGPPPGRGDFPPAPPHDLDL